MQFDSTDSGSFARHLQSYLPSVITENHGFLTAVTEALHDHEKLATHASSEVRKERLNLSLPTETLRERVIFNVDGKIVVAGVRFKQLDLKFPFIALNPNFNLDAKALEQLTPVVLAEFQAVQPKGLTFDQAPGAIPGTQAWSHIVFGDSSVFYSTALPNELRVSWPAHFTHYAEYHAAYVERLKTSPELQSFVRIESEEDLQAAAQNGLLLQIEDTGGTYQGVIGGQEVKLYGLPSLYIFEIFLGQAIQGKGYAPLLQKFFLHALRSRFTYVWGNIHEPNIRSLKTAQRVGRKIIQTEHFYPFT